MFLKNTKIFLSMSGSGSYYIQKKVYNHQKKKNFHPKTDKHHHHPKIYFFNNPTNLLQKIKILKSKVAKIKNIISGNEI